MTMLDQIDALDDGALFSPCRRWRYLLWRRWDADKGICAFIGLNPSTADESVNDPTVRRCMRFARDWGYGSLWMLNAYAFRATDPRALFAAIAQVSVQYALGPQNNEYVKQAALHCDLVVAAWGAHCDEVRSRQMRQTFGAVGKPLYALGVTKSGEPRHPLYLSSELKPHLWVGAMRDGDGQ